MPCCVFPDLFPDRRIPSSSSTTTATGAAAGTAATRPVITTDDFITYLVRKASGGSHDHSGEALVGKANGSSPGAHAQRGSHQTGAGVPLSVVQVATLPFEGRNRVVFAARARQSSMTTTSVT